MPDLVSIFELPPGPVVYVVVVAVVIAASLPVVAIAVPAEPLLIAAVLLTRNDPRISIWLILGLVTAASIAGDSLSYYLGYSLGRHVGSRLAPTKAMGLIRATIRKSQVAVRDGGLTPVLAQRWLPPGRGFIPAIVGANRLPYRTFVRFAAVAAGPWAGILVLGTRFGGVWLVNLAAVTLTVTLFAKWLRRRTVRRRNRPTPHTTSSKS